MKTNIILIAIFVHFTSVIFGQHIIVEQPVNDTICEDNPSLSFLVKVSDSVSLIDTVFKIVWQTTIDTSNIGTFAEIDDSVIDTIITDSLTSEIILTADTILYFYDRFFRCILDSASSCIDSSKIVWGVIKGIPVVDAGNDISICENSSAVFNGSAENCDSILWYGGNGQWEDENTTQPTYIPSGEDDTVTISLLGYNAVCGNDTDNITLIVRKNPIVDAGNDTSICENSSVVFNAIIENYDSVLWYGGNGYWQNENTTQPTYIPSGEDDTVTISLLGYNAVCGDVDDNFTLFIRKKSTVYAGNDISICGNDPITFSAYTKNCDSILWHGGNGQWEDENTTQPTYIPSGEDDTVTISLLGYNTVCGNDIDEIKLFVQQLPSIETEDTIIFRCNFSEIELYADTCNGADGFRWQGGKGIWDTTDIYNPVYKPLVADTIQEKYAELQFIAYFGDCPVVLNNYKIIISGYPFVDTLIPKPADNPVMLICQDSGYYYQWYGNNSIIESQTNQFLYPLNFVDTTLIKVKVINKYDTTCYDFSESYLYIPGSTGNNGVSFSFSPNPADNSVIINLSREPINNMEALHLDIYSAEGQFVKSLKITGSHTTVSTVSLKKGIYPVLLFDGNRLLSSAKLLILR